MNIKIVLEPSFFFGGSTTFGSKIDQQDSWVEFALKKQDGNKIFNYKNYSVPGYCSNNDLALIKELKKNSKLKNKILFLNHGWNEEFHSSVSRDNRYRSLLLFRSKWFLIHR